jgi:hypothetical protein
VFNVGFKEKNHCYRLPSYPLDRGRLYKETGNSKVYSLLPRGASNLTVHSSLKHLQNPAFGNSNTQAKTMLRG